MIYIRLNSQTNPNIVLSEPYDLLIYLSGTTQFFTQENLKLWFNTALRTHDMKLLTNERSDTC